ncbi:Putative mediator complex, subunit Med17 [Septoria linicola]|uniref:Mediator of RNA polymerase II transcription subunit 17 n=1 Tax=Septoria linicola TaxID=215465 RepID=A0A9Q9B112_9PEZI|nr:putative mediator complex, subunit Med17 [Septoria linicola]USW55326.1 Putative mediator complex, subunit Med17 [Septoria linicola]
MAPDGSAGASFRPWTTSGRAPPALSEILAQSHAERGHFRNLTEASLQAEIEADEPQSLQSDSDDEEEEDQDGDSQRQAARAPPATRQELYAIRQEFVNEASQAHQDVLVALDMISLLHSTYSSAQGATTLSPAAKQVLPLSSLGVDVWARTPAVPGRDIQNSSIAMNVRAKELNESADSLLSAAKRLQDNVTRQQQYFSQILDIKDKGWNVSRIPNQPHLCVHFGFSGSSQGFAGRNIAALIPDDQGDIKLERGLGTQPKAVRALVKRGNRVMGTSTLPSLPEISQTTLDTRLRHARDSAFDEELFHEMTRESRSLRSRGVIMKGLTIKVPIADTEDSPYVELDQVVLDEDNAPPIDATHDSDHIAQAMVLAARLLLSRAHSDRIKAKSAIPRPMGSKDDRQESLPILGPIMTFAQHCWHVMQINSYVSNVQNLLKSAHVPATTKMACVEILAESQGAVDTQVFKSALLQPLSAEASITVEGIEPFRLVAETSPQNVPYFHLKYIKNGKPNPWDTVDDLLHYTDQHFPDSIARYLSGKVEGWRFNDRSGELLRKDDLARRATFVTLAGLEGQLKLQSGSETVNWSLSDGSEDRVGIVDALKNMKD